MQFEIFPQLKPRPSALLEADDRVRSGGLTSLEREAILDILGSVSGPEQRRNDAA